MPKENIYYSCIACITIDSEYKYRRKKTQMPKFIKNELKSDSESDSDLDSDDKELMAKLSKSDIDFDCYSDSEVAKLMAKKN